MKNKLNKNKDLHEDIIEEDNISIHPFTWFYISSNASACIARAESTLFCNKWNFDNVEHIHSEIHLSDLAGHFLRTEKEIEFLTKKVKFDIEQSIADVIEPLSKNVFLSYSDKIDGKTHEVLSNYQVFLKRELLFVHLLDVFEDIEKGERWLHEPNGALDNQRPIDFTNNSEGIEKVDKILGRIEHGIFS